MKLRTRDDIRDFLTRLDTYTPTEEQLDVITAPAEPGLVIAGAGSGKTKVMALRVVYHVAAGLVDPEHVLGLTFTRKAANELSIRVASMLKKASTLDVGIDPDQLALSRPTISTYNSFASSIATDYGLLVGLDPSARLITDAERYDIINSLVENWDEKLNTTVAVRTLVTDVMAMAGQILDNQLTTDQVRGELATFENHFHQDHFGQLTKSSELFKALERHPNRYSVLDIVDAYLEYKKTHQLTEFADQVASASTILAMKPDLVDELRAQHQLVLLDEYQDTSVNQARFLSQIFADTHVMAVGDPNQAIYGWRGASASALADFTHAFTSASRMPQYNLSEGFRNDSQILEVANKIAEPLREHASREGLTVKPLSAFNTGGEVELAFPEFADESYAAIARDIATYREAHRDMNGGKGPSIAILCRARSSFTPMAQALDNAGLNYLVVGHEQAISSPECRLIRGLIRSAIQPDRVDGIMHAITYLNIGTRDLKRISTASREHGTFLETLQHLDTIDISDESRARLTRVVEWLQTLQDRRFASLAELIHTAISVTGLDIDVASQSERGGIGRTSLAILSSLAHSYDSQIEGPTMTGFLNWLDNLEKFDKSGDSQLPMADLGISTEVSDETKEQPDHITIMTMHGAKGLEWDYVAIPELAYGRFDLNRGKATDAWTSSNAKIPAWLRADHRSLPEWRWKDVEEPKQAQESLTTWLYETLPAHENRETRRLAYVAVTRPRHRLFLAGYWYKDATHAKSVQDSLTQGKAYKAGPSILLNGLGFDIPSEPPQPTRDPDEDQVYSRWPDDCDRGWTAGVERARELVIDASPTWDEDAQPAWVSNALSDISGLRQEENDPRLLDHVTAGHMMELATDANRFRKNILRPIPDAPARAARLGQHIHEYIASAYSATRAVDLTELDALDAYSGLDLNDDHVARLIERFERTPFATQTPLAIERSVSVKLGEVTLRGTIDAVFPDGEGVRIIDWKTGRKPRDFDIKALQLHLYRHAWATIHNMDPERVAASFVYLGEDSDENRIIDVPYDADMDVHATATALLAASGLSQQLMLSSELSK